MVRHNDNGHPYCTQKDAMKAAVDAGHPTGKKVFDAQVLVQAVPDHTLKF
jgi:hypothetical protein